jgi:hypothetical protein
MRPIGGPSRDWFDPGATVPHVHVLLVRSRGIIGEAIASLLKRHDAFDRTRAGQGMSRHAPDPPPAAAKPALETMAHGAADLLSDQQWC